MSGKICNPQYCARLAQEYKRTYFKKLTPQKTLKLCQTHVHYFKTLVSMLSLLQFFMINKSPGNLPGILTCGLIFMHLS